MLVICSVNCFVGFAITEFYGEKTETSCKSIAYVRDTGSYVMHDDDTHLTASSQDNPIQVSRYQNTFVLDFIRAEVMEV